MYSVNICMEIRLKNVLPVHFLHSPTHQDIRLNFNDLDGPVDRRCYVGQYDVIDRLPRYSDIFKESLLLDFVAKIIYDL